MKKLLISIVIMPAWSTLFAQHSLEKIWESDSVTLRNPESVYILVLADGSMLVSDDTAGVIYRISYKK